MINITRTFYPVGQGAFYGESLEFENGEFNIVYDCGSTNKKALGAQINQLPEKDIDILFVSHFHEDHINGIPDLIKKRNVKRVVLPYLDFKQKLFFIGALQGTNNSQLANFIYNPVQFFDNQDKQIAVSFVMPIEGGHNEGNDTTISVDELGKSIKSGTPIVVSDQYNKSECKSKRIYLPINIPIAQTQISEFIAWLVNEGILKSLSDEGSHINLDEQTIQTIKYVYIKVFKKEKMNETSMLLYSGPCCCEHYCHRCYDYCCRIVNRPFHERFCIPCGCLYMGDIELTAQNVPANILSYYKPYNRCIGTVQVPHHGSNTSNEPAFWDNYRNRIGIISFGETNRYRHPHSGTLSTLRAYNIEIMPVTDNQLTKAEFVFQHDCC